MNNMDKLQQKFRNDNLTPDELRRLREEVNLMSNDRLEDSLCKAWDSAEDYSNDDHRLDELKMRIDQRLFPSYRVVPLYWKVFRIAAAILLPLFVISTVYLYQENTALSQKDFVFSTGKGEQVTISLPDGTQVTLNAESSLSYNLSNFNSDERQVSFDGEGYFCVTKNLSSPFSISAKGLKVSVLGTTFNLRARSTDATTELSLEEGSVRFQSLKTGQSVILSPNQKAILDQTHGTVTIEESSYATDASAWKRGELVFRNVPFAEVLEEIEETYHVSITIETEEIDYQKDLFTGVLSRTNINEALEVIEYSYHLKATLKDGIIKLVDSQ